MSSTHRQVRALVFFLILGSLPLFAIRKGDTPSSGNGLFGNCPAVPNGDTCPVLNAQGTATLTGTDAGGNSVTVTINLYDWGSYICNTTTCTPVINSAALDVVLTGTDTVGIQSIVVKGVLSRPAYVTCGGPGATVGLACVLSPAPDDNSDIQEPMPIAGADNANTRWDFGGLPPLAPPLPAIPFDQLVCSPDGHDAICGELPTTLGEAVLTVSNSVGSNNLGTDASNYLVTLTDGTQLGSLVVPASPTKNAANINNTQATATVITTSPYNDYTDTSQAFPQISPDGTPNYPVGFALAPAPPPTSSSWPSCYPTNGQTGNPTDAQGNPSDPNAADYRTFRTVWYTYTTPSNGSISISTGGSRYDTLVYVFTGSTSNTVSCNDDPASGGLPQAVTTFTATQGTIYQIAVYETPTFMAGSAGSTTGYPLSVDGALYFSLAFTPNAPTASLSTTSLQFGGQQVNSSSMSQTVTLTNIGMNELTGISPSVSAGFSQTNNCSAVLTTNQTCTIDVTFAPTSAGVSSGTLVVMDNASNSPQSVTLSGTGTDFQISVPATLTVAAGLSATATITVAPVDGFSGAVALACSATSLPAGVSCGFNPASVTGGSGSSTLTVTTTSDAQPNTYSLIVAGTSGATTHTESFSLVVSSDFQISATALSPGSLTPGQSATAAITITPSSGFSSAVSLTCTITPTASVPPSCKLAPNSLANGAGTSTLSISTMAAVARLSPSRLHQARFFYASMLPFGGLMLLLSGIPVAGHKRRWGGVVLVCVLLLSLALTSSCGGGGSTSNSTGGGSAGTTPGNYTVTVTVSGGSGSQQQTTLGLTIQ